MAALLSEMETFCLCPSFYDGTDSDFVVEQLSRGSVHVALMAKRETWHTKK